MLWSARVPLSPSPGLIYAGVLAAAAFEPTANKFSLLYADLRKAVKQVAMGSTSRVLGETHHPFCCNTELTHLNQMAWNGTNWAISHATQWMLNGKEPQKCYQKTGVVLKTRLGGGRCGMCQAWGACRLDCHFLNYLGGDRGKCCF